MADTSLSLYEIEVAIARSRQFNFVQKLVVYNIVGHSSVLPLHHECDMLVCTNAGFLTEIEIKRSYADFLNDFKKRHNHYSKYIKNFYYCIPLKIKDKVISFLENFEDQNDYRVKAGIIVFHEDGWIDDVKAPHENKHAVKLSLEQMFYLARLGSMRVISLKDKIAKQNKSKCKNI